MLRLGQSLATAVSLFLCLCFVAAHYGWRKENPSFDPRNQSIVKRVSEERVRDSFRARLLDSRVRPYFAPALKSAHLSVNWLELLSRLHHPQSYQGEFSWLFSMLQRVVSLSHPSEVLRLLSLAPYFFVIGEDQVGATYLMQSLLFKRGDLWKTWAWSAFHAMENLGDRRLAADLFANASALEGAPAHLSLLALRLGMENVDESQYAQERQRIVQQLPKHLLEEIKRKRPEYFEN